MNVYSCIVLVKNFNIFDYKKKCFRRVIFYKKINKEKEKN